MLKSQHDTLCILGTVLSSYALYVKYAHQQDSTFTPVIGSTAAFSSDYGKGLGGLIRGENIIAKIPNSVLGIVHYALMFLLSQGCFWESQLFSKLRLGLSLASGLPCFWLAYVLMFILHDTCSICITMYGINAAFIWVNYQQMLEISDKQKTD